MDYLTIITTRKLLLFPSPKTPSIPASHPDSPPTTPTDSLPAPLPIAIPLSNLLSPDSRLFFFLQQHILRRPEHMTTRDERADAEVLVWRELAKAGTFIRELGMAAGRGELREAGLKELARRCGLKWVSEGKSQRVLMGESLAGEAVGNGTPGHGVAA